MDVVSLSYHKQAQFGDRLQAATKAREAMLNRFKARPAGDDPEVVARQAARVAQAQARAQRTSEREAARAAQAEALAAQRAADAKEAERRRAEAETEQKLARDARYAARKSRTRR